MILLILWAKASSRMSRINLYISHFWQILKFCFNYFSKRSTVHLYKTVFRRISTKCFVICRNTFTVNITASVLSIATCNFKMLVVISKVCYLKTQWSEINARLNGIWQRGLSPILKLHLSFVWQRFKSIQEEFRDLHFDEWSK